jgi:hypothetical protein
MGTDDPLDPMLGEAISRLRDTHPDQDLWPHIARQLEPVRPHGTLVIRWPTALAAGLVIAIATSASTAVLLRHHLAPDSTKTIATTVSPALSTVAASFAPGDAALARATDDLERVVRASLGQLDPEARTTVTKTLTMLDQAIAQAAERQIAAPDDPHAAKYLTSTLRKKLQLLRTVSELTQRQS